MRTEVTRDPGRRIRRAGVWVAVGALLMYLEAALDRREPVIQGLGFVLIMGGLVIASEVWV